MSECQIRKIYNSHGADMKMNDRSGQIVEVLRRVNSSYRVKFVVDGLETIVHENELSPIPIRGGLKEVVFALRCAKSENSHCTSCPYAVLKNNGTLDFCDLEALESDAAEIIEMYRNRQS